MRALFKTLFGDLHHIAGVGFMLCVAAGLAAIGRGDWAVFAVPVIGIGVVAWLAGH